MYLYYAMALYASAVNSTVIREQNLQFHFRILSWLCIFKSCNIKQCVQQKIKFGLDMWILYHKNAFLHTSFYKASLQHPSYQHILHVKKNIH
jgi:hypothetical protein